MEATEIIEYLRAGFYYFWLKTQEPNRVRKKIYPLIESFTKKDGSKFTIKEWTCLKSGNIMPTITEFISELEANGVLFCYNMHNFMSNNQLIQLLQDAGPILSARNKAIVAVAPVEKIPIELEKEFTPMQMSLPDNDEIGKIIQHVAPSEDFIPKGRSLEKLLSACKTLTHTEIEQVLALSAVKTKSFDTTIINDYRAMTLKKTGFLKVIPPIYKLKDIIGYDGYKSFVMDTIDNPKAKGNLLIGPPGCGKTMLQYAFVGETGRFGVEVKMGKLFSKYQGETDHNIAMLIDLISQYTDLYVLIDEFEKQFSGVAGAGETDGGVAKRALSQWLDFLQNRPPGIYVSGTANSFVGIPGEYIRPGRWDSSPFYMGLPNAKVRKKILEHYAEKEGIKIGKDYPEMEHFTGGEIEALVHIASMRGLTLKQAEKSVIPLYNTKGEEIKALEAWAKTACLPADNIPFVKEVAKRSLDV